jgi:hypothetical protein
VPPGAAHIEAARTAAPFAKLEDVARRTRLPRSLLETLIGAGTSGHHDDLYTEPSLDDLTGHMEGIEVADTSVER